LVFARRPAPVQVSAAGYPGSAGLDAIEYRISDRWLESGDAEMGEERFARRSKIEDRRSGRWSGADLPSPNSELRTAERIFLTDSFWCYDSRGVDMPVGALPAMESKGVTFGCLNNFCKVNARVLALWARILERVEGSRLLLLSPAGNPRERTLAVMRQLGVDGSRVEFVAPQPRLEYLHWYHRVDIGLETFPYNGHTTSLDAFWMGVPVPALVGGLPVARAGLSHLMNLGLPELVASSAEEYVNLVVDLAEDLPRLAELRRTLRSRMENSVLMDAPRFARQIEAAYRVMWREWCAGQHLLGTFKRECL
jgi:predicted O-linked N-acetylglucosamine transferase (SPINDLY family)